MFLLFALCIDKITNKLRPPCPVALSLNNRRMLSTRYSTPVPRHLLQQRNPRYRVASPIISLFVSFPFPDDIRTNYHLFLCVCVCHVSQWGLWASSPSPSTAAILRPGHARTRSRGCSPPPRPPRRRLRTTCPPPRHPPWPVERVWPERRGERVHQATAVLLTACPRGGTRSWHCPSPINDWGDETSTHSDREGFTRHPGRATLAIRSDRDWRSGDT